MYRGLQCLHTSYMGRQCKNRTRKLLHWSQVEAFRDRLLGTSETVPPYSYVLTKQVHWGRYECLSPWERHPSHVANRSWQLSINHSQFLMLWKPPWIVIHSGDLSQAFLVPNNFHQWLFSYLIELILIYRLSNYIGMNH